jgi:Ca2+-binding EF-hand superfamily protein
MWAFFHIAISVSILAASVRDVSELSKARQEALRKMDMVKGSLDVDLMMSLDKDGDGVNQFEFVIGMLTMLDAVKQEDVDMFVKLFEALDSDASGKLDENDIRAGLEDRQKQLQLMQIDQRPMLKMIEAGFKPERARSGSPPYM